MEAAPADRCTVRCVHPDAVGRARAAISAEPALDAAAALFGALGDPTRLRLLRALTDGELCTCDLAAVLGVTESAVSHGLRLLKERSLVESRRVGRVVYHRLADAHVAALVRTGLAHAAEPAPPAEVAA